MNFKQFGGKLNDNFFAKYQQSPNWKNGRFQNLEPTEMAGGLSKLPGIIYKQLTARTGKAPENPLPILPFDRKAFLASSQASKFIWYGHSAVLMRMNNKTLLIDPMLGPDTTPIAPFVNKRFSENTLMLIDDFPEIDLVLLTHDHYDHLDYESIQKLKHKTKKYFVALGVKRHLISWGIPPDLIVEFDWWDRQVFENITITFTPTRHFSGRGLTDRQQSLWGGWAFQNDRENIWFSGDSGYGNHFLEIGNRLGPFQFAFVECGQYNDDWPQIHMFPNESVQAALDARASKAMPVHWGGFALSYQHSWTEPVEAFIKSALAKNVAYSTPKLGQLFQITSSDTDKWWLSAISSSAR